VTILKREMSKSEPTTFLTRSYRRNVRERSVGGVEHARGRKSSSVSVQVLLHDGLLPGRLRRVLSSKTSTKEREKQQQTFQPAKILLPR
jgi:hypothetical protein